MVEDLKEWDGKEDEVLSAPELEGQTVGRDWLSHSWRHGEAGAAFAWG